MRVISIVSLLLILKYTYTQNAYLYNTISNKSYDTVQCMYTILNQSFPCGNLTAFVNPNEYINQLIKLMNEKTSCHTAVVRSFNNRKWFIWTNGYIISVENVNELQDGMKDIAKDVFWNPRAKFIVQVTNIANDKDLREIFTILLNYKIYRVVLLTTSKKDDKIYTYNPFRNQNCGKTFNDIDILGTCENKSNIKKFLPHIVPNTVNNCSLRVVAFDDVPNFISKSSNYTVYGKYVLGLEQYVLETIADRVGFKVEYEILDANIPYGIVLPNRSTTGLLHYIDTGKADVSSGGFALMKNRVELFDYLWGFNYAAFNLYTPTAGTHLWKRVYTEFGSRTWSYILATLCLLVFVCLVIKTLLKDETFSLLNLWGYFFGNANKGLSQHKQFRIIIFSWAWFTFYISNFYNTALVSLVSIHVHPTTHSISPENLRSLPFKPCISDDTTAFFEFAYNQTLPKSEPIYNCTFEDGSLEYVASTKKYYAIEMEYHYKLKEYLYLDEDGKTLLDSWTFSSINVIVMYLVRGFPFKNRFQKYASRMYEGGLVMNHLKTIQLRSYSVLQRYPKQFKETAIEDLSLHFCLLFGGCFLSFLCFILEICFHRKGGKKSEKRKQQA